MILDAEYIKKNYESVMPLLVLRQIQVEYERNAYVSSIVVNLGELALNMGFTLPRLELDIELVLNELTRLEERGILKIRNLHYAAEPVTKSAKLPYDSDFLNIQIPFDSLNFIEPSVNTRKKSLAPIPKKIWNGVAEIEVLLSKERINQEYKKKITEFLPTLEQLSLRKQRNEVEASMAKKGALMGKNKMVFGYDDMLEKFPHFWLREVNLFFVLLWLESEGGLDILSLNHDGNPYRFDVELTPYLFHGALMDKANKKKSTFVINLSEKFILFEDGNIVPLTEGEQFYELLEILIFQPNAEISNKDLAMRLSKGAADGKKHTYYNNKITKILSRIRGNELNTKKSRAYDIFKVKTNFTSLKR